MLQLPLGNARRGSAGGEVLDSCSESSGGGGVNGVCLSAYAQENKLNFICIDRDVYTLTHSHIHALTAFRPQGVTVIVHFVVMISVRPMARGRGRLGHPLGGSRLHPGCCLG